MCTHIKQEVPLFRFPVHIITSAQHNIIIWTFYLIHIFFLQARTNTHTMSSRFFHSISSWSFCSFYFFVFVSSSWWSCYSFFFSKKLFWYRFFFSVKRKSTSLPFPVYKKTILGIMMTMKICIYFRQKMRMMTREKNKKCTYVDQITWSIKRVDGSWPCILLLHFIWTTHGNVEKRELWLAWHGG